MGQEGTGVAMAMAVPLCLLDGVDHICYRHDILPFILWDLLDIFGVLSYVVPVGKLRLVFYAAVADTHREALAIDVFEISELPRVGKGPVVEVRE